MISPRFAFPLALLAGLLLGTTAHPASPTSLSLTPDARRQTIELVLAKVNSRYVLPEVARAIDSAIRQQMASGAFDTVLDKAELCRRLTAEMQKVSMDPHLALVLRQEVDDPVVERPNAKEREALFQAGRLTNFGFEAVQRLRCNVGYLDLREFSAADAAASTAQATMGFLRNTDALIVDLRENSGGTTRMHLLFASYLFGETPVHLNNIEWRGGEQPQQLWTCSATNSARQVGKRLYLLTSPRTFSQAEALAYELQALKRAIVVGEATRGGAHLTQRYRLDSDLYLWLPIGRFVHPVTRRNWEGVGVKPDLAVPEKDALSNAYLLALQHLQSRNSDPLLIASYQEMIDATRRKLEQSQPLAAH